MEFLRVVVGVIRRGEGIETEYLLAQRAKNKLFATYWEFPGGKVEKNESLTQALRRELMEELGINVDTQSCRKIMEIPWQYESLMIRLYIFIVEHFCFTPYSAEGQKIQWWKQSAIKTNILPAANRGLVTALKFPQYYVVSGNAVSSKDFLGKMKRCLQANTKLLQIRMPNQQWQAWQEKDQSFVHKLGVLARQYSCKLLFNSQCCTSEDWRLPEGFAGWHVRSFDLRHPKLKQAIKNSNGHLWGASVHNLQELKLAESQGVDFVCIAPLLLTTSNESKKPLGFSRARALSCQATVPFYYLGGLNSLHLPISKKMGAQGIAGISGFW